MIAGKASNTDASKVSRGNICHRCWKSTNDNQFTGGAPCSGSDTVEVPMDLSCKMVRQTLIFPTCWDGKNLDSPDHQSHVAYSGTGASGGGSCPSSHPVKLPQVMYELMWNTSSFMDKSIWPADGTNPFIYSMNLGGAAAHGDYVFGWKGDSLQKAMDKNCNLNKDCPAAGLHALSPDVYSACTKKQQAPEDVDGCKSFPGATAALVPHTDKSRAQGSPHGRDGDEGIGVTRANGTRSHGPGLSVPRRSSLSFLASLILPVVVAPVTIPARAFPRRSLHPLFLLCSQDRQFSRKFLLAMVSRLLTVETKLVRSFSCQPLSRDLCAPAEDAGDAASVLCSRRGSRERMAGMLRCVCCAVCIVGADIESHGRSHVEDSSVSVFPRPRME